MFLFCPPEQQFYAGGIKGPALFNLTAGFFCPSFYRIVLLGARVPPTRGLQIRSLIREICQKNLMEVVGLGSR